MPVSVVDGCRGWRVARPVPGTHCAQIASVPSWAILCASAVIAVTFVTFQLPVLALLPLLTPSAGIHLLHPRDRHVAVRQVAVPRLYQVGQGQLARPQPRCLWYLLPWSRYVSTGCDGTELVMWDILSAVDAVTAAFWACLGTSPRLTTKAHQLTPQRSRHHRLAPGLLVAQVPL